jgi:hypothetical protein
MRLCVSFCSTSARTYADYDITPDDGTRELLGCLNKEEYEHLLSLKPRIEEMCRRELGDSFLRVEAVNDFGLVLFVKVGTSRSSEKKFKLRSLFGWIELFDSETAPA